MEKLFEWFFFFVERGSKVGGFIQILTIVCIKKKKICKIVKVALWIVYSPTHKSFIEMKTSLFACESKVLQSFCQRSSIFVRENNENEMVFPRHIFLL